MYARPSAARAISFEYLNRQLVWHELSELLLFVLPLVDVGAIRRALRARLPRLPVLAGGAAGAALGAGQQGGWVVMRCCLGLESPRCKLDCRLCELLAAGPRALCCSCSSLYFLC